MKQIRAVTMKMFCIRCFTPVVPDGTNWRHDPKFLGQDFLCQDYGYHATAITEDEKKIFEVENILDGKTEFELLCR